MAPSSSYALSLHDALPIFPANVADVSSNLAATSRAFFSAADSSLEPDRKSTRLNSSHDSISYAAFCLKKKKPIPPPYGENAQCNLKHPETYRQTQHRNPNS